MRAFIREKKVIAGEYMDVSIYACWRRSGERRKKAKPTEDAQAEVNRRNSELNLMRNVHANFDGRDLFVTLTYGDAFMPKGTREEVTAAAIRDMKNFIKRLRGDYKKAGKELKYIYTLEFGAASDRPHFHMIANDKTMRDAIEDRWIFGHANARRLEFDEKGVEGLLEYMCKSKTGYRRYSSSKNLVKPVEIIDDYSMTATKAKRMEEEGTAGVTVLEQYDGWVCTEMETKTDAFGGKIMHMKFCKADSKVYGTEKTKRAEAARRVRA